MEISADKAYWLLESFRTRSKRLHLAGRIGDEEAGCDAVVIAVDRELKLAVVELFEENGTNSWCRAVPLGDATFYLSMMGDPEFDQWAGSMFHLVLVIQYPDATMLLLGEGFQH